MIMGNLRAGRPRLFGIQRPRGEIVLRENRHGDSRRVQRRASRVADRRGARRKNGCRFACQTNKTPRSRGADGVRALPRRDPLKVRGRREDRAPAGAHGPRAEKTHAAEPQAQPESTRPSRRSGLNGCSALSSVTVAWLPPSPARRVSVFASLAPA
jgi:hypothetical protein